MFLFLSLYSICQSVFSRIRWSKKKRNGDGVTSKEH